MRLICIPYRCVLILALGMMGYLIPVLVAPAEAANQFKLKPGAQGKICLKCHTTFQKTLKSRAVHSPIKTGNCSDCHDPHTSSHKMLLSANITDLCSSCHKEVLPAKARSGTHLFLPLISIIQLPNRVNHSATFPCCSFKVYDTPRSLVRFSEFRSVSALRRLTNVEAGLIPSRISVTGPAIRAGINPAPTKSMKKAVPIGTVFWQSL